jgi:hypothetical protein
MSRFKPTKQVIGVASAALVMLASSFAVASEAMISKGAKAFAVYQRVGLADDGYPVSMNAKAGTLQSVKGVLTVSGRASELPGTIVGSLPHIPQSIPHRTQSQWIATANYWFPYQYENFLKPNFLPFMQSKGFSSAVFDFGQRVIVNASPAPRIKWLSWRVIVDSSGRARYADAKLLDESPQPLYVLYTPKKVADGLPPGSGYTDAGTIKWHLMDASGNAITGTTTIDVNGAYDQPEVDAGAPDPLPAGCSRNPDTGDAECDIAFGLECLINNQSKPSCPTGYVDVRQLIDLTAPSWVIVDYARHVQPVYEPVVQTDGSIAEELKTSVTITKREWKVGKTYFFISPGGATKFNVEGNYGYEIRMQTERYRVNSDDLTYTMLGIDDSVTAAPTTVFAKSASVPQGATCAGYTYNIIDPFATNQVYDWRFDTVNNLPPERYLSVAPLNCY